MASKENTASDEAPSKPVWAVPAVRKWFCDKNLSCTKEIDRWLELQGVDCVEELKLITIAQWENLLCKVCVPPYKPIKYRVFLATFKTLCKDEFDETKTAPLPIHDSFSSNAKATDDSTDASSSETKAKRKANYSGGNNGKWTMQSFFRTIPRKKRKEKVAHKATRSSMPPSNKSRPSDYTNSSQKEQGGSVINLYDDDDDECGTGSSDTVVEAVHTSRKRGAASISCDASKSKHLTITQHGDWRSGRQGGAELLEMATDLEKERWKESPALEIFEGATLDECGIKSDNLEDILGYYRVLGGSRATSDTDMAHLAKEAERQNRKRLAASHPDRGGDKEKFQEMNNEWEAEMAGAVATLANAEARIACDMKCDRAINLWRSRTHFKIEAAQEEETLKQRYKKRSQNLEDKQSKTPLQKATEKDGLYNRKGKQQTNEWRIAVYEAISSGSKVNDLAHRIRNNFYTSWSGSCKDKIYKKTYELVSDTYKKGKEGLLLHGVKLEALSPSERRAYLVSTTVHAKEKRGNKVGNVLKAMESKLEKRLAELSSTGCRITRLIIFREVMKLSPSFIRPGQNRMKQLKTWFYYGLKRRCNLSYTRKSGAGQKLPNGWEEKVKDINARCNSIMHPHRIDGVPGEYVAVPPMAFCNTDHVPTWREPVGEYTWGKKGSGRRNIRTGGKEKERFTVQLSITFSKKNNKLRPYVIWKGTPVSPPYGRNTIMYEITERTKDSNGNEYPSDDKIVMTVSKTANSSGELTNDVLDRVILPGIGVVDSEGKENGNAGGVLVDDFKGHSKQCVKDRTALIRKLHFLIMAGGITPKAQPLDILINKIWKAFYRDLYDLYMLEAPLNAAGNPIAPSRQLIAQWTVEAWEKVPEGLVYKSFLVAGYKDPTDEPDPTCTAIVEAVTATEYREKLVRLIGNAAGEDAVTAYKESEDFDGSDVEDDEEG